MLGPGLAKHGFHLPFDDLGLLPLRLGRRQCHQLVAAKKEFDFHPPGGGGTRRLGLSIMIFALAPWMWLSVTAAVGAGLSGVVAGSTAQAMLRQLAGPERTLQVMGLWAVAWAGSKPFASLIDGVLPGLTSVRITGVIMAVPALLPPLVLILMPEVAQRVISKRPSQAPREPHQPQWEQPFTQPAGGRIAA